MKKPSLILWKRKFTSLRQRPASSRPARPWKLTKRTFADSHLIELDLDKYVDDFNRRVIGAYQEGKGSAVLPADLGVARSLIPPGREHCAISVISLRRFPRSIWRNVSAA